MAHHIDKDIIARGNSALLQIVVWGALGATVVAALIFDIKQWVM